MNQNILIPEAKSDVRIALDPYRSMLRPGIVAELETMLLDATLTHPALAQMAGLARSARPDRTFTYHFLTLCRIHMETCTCPPGSHALLARARPLCEAIRDWPDGQCTSIGRAARISRAEAAVVQAACDVPPVNELPFGQLAWGLAYRHLHGFSHKRLGHRTARMLCAARNALCDEIAKIPHEIRRAGGNLRAILARLAELVVFAFIAQMQRYAEMAASREAANDNARSPESRATGTG